MGYFELVVTMVVVVAVKGFTVAHLRKTAEQLAVARMEVGRHEQWLAAVQKARLPLTGKLTELNLVLTEMNRQVSEFETKLKSLVARNQELRAEIDTY